MITQEQRELEALINYYNSVDPVIIKKNIVKYINESSCETQYIADKLNLKIETIYAYRQPKKRHTIAFEIALKLANLLNIDITQLIEQ